MGGRRGLGWRMDEERLDKDPVRREVAEGNGHVDSLIRKTVERYAGEPEMKISERIGALDAEWDIERVLEANAATVMLAGALSAAAGRRRGILLGGVVAGFLLMNALQGWCPPLTLLRRLGVRTRREIEREKFVLRFLRGDFEHLTRKRPRKSPGEILAAAR
ncbi:MAG TPA: YgaP-like transmembrane domain [Opitutus sp.]|nr:YgaP-like transmembrane domain [Opitutus sp.]